QARAGGGREARGLSAAVDRLERAPRRAGGLEAVARGAVEDLLGGLAHTEAVDDVGAGDAPEGAQAESHAALRHAHGVTVPSRWIVSGLFALRTTKRPLSCWNVTRPGRKIGFLKLTSTV